MADESVAQCQTVDPVRDQDEAGGGSRVAQCQKGAEDHGESGAEVGTGFRSDPVRLVARRVGEQAKGRENDGVKCPAAQDRLYRSDGSAA